MPACLKEPFRPGWVGSLLFGGPCVFSGARRPSRGCFPLSESGVSRGCKAVLICKVFLKPISGWVARGGRRFVSSLRNSLVGTRGLAIPRLAPRPPGPVEPQAVRSSRRANAGRAGTPGKAPPASQIIHLHPGRSQDRKRQFPERKPNVLATSPVNIYPAVGTSQRPIVLFWEGSEPRCETSS